VRLRGFRPGKAPRAIVERQYGASVKSDLVDRVAKRSLQRAVDEHKLNIVEVVQVEVQKMEPPEAVEIGVSFEVYPTPTISNYLGRTVTVPAMKLIDEHVESIVQGVLKQKAKLTPITDRTDAQRGDVVELKVQVKSGDQDFSPAEPLSEALGDGKLPTQVEDGLIGMKIGETREISVPVEKKEAEESTEGGDLVYRIELVGLSARELPELNDEFVKGLNAGVDTVEGFRAQVRERGEAEMKQSTADNVRQAIIQMLVSEHQFEIPQILIDRELRALCRQYGLLKGSEDESKLDLSQVRPFMQPTAIHKLRAGIICDRIAEHEGVTVEAADVRLWANQVAKKHGGRASTYELAWSEKASRSRSFIEEEVRRTKVIELLVSKTVVEYSEPEAQKQQQEQGATV
jgi:trigger factor